MLGLPRRSALALDLDVAIALRGQTEELKNMEEAREEMKQEGGGAPVRKAEDMMGPRRH